MVKGPHRTLPPSSQLLLYREQLESFTNASNIPSFLQWPDQYVQSRDAHSVISKTISEMFKVSPRFNKLSRDGWRTFLLLRVQHPLLTAEASECTSSTGCHQDQAHDVDVICGLWFWSLKISLGSFEGSDYFGRTTLAERIPLAQIVAFRSISFREYEVRHHIEPEFVEVRAWFPSYKTKFWTAYLVLDPPAPTFDLKTFSSSTIWWRIPETGQEGRPAIYKPCSNPKLPIDGGWGLYFWKRFTGWTSLGLRLEPEEKLIEVAEIMCYSQSVDDEVGVAEPRESRLYWHCCFTLKLPSPAPVTRATPSHLVQALLRHCSGTDQEMIRK